MKRDMDIIRRIVLAARDEATPVRSLDGVSADVFAEHVRLLEEAGLVGAAVQLVQQRATAALVWRLTWAGHEFADAISSDTLWRKGGLAEAAKQMVRQLLNANGAEKIRVRLTDDSEPIDLFMAPLKGRIQVQMMGRYPAANDVFQALEGAYDLNRENITNIPN